jgi:Outer membrane protein beta-barrel domain
MRAGLFILKTSVKKLITIAACFISTGAFTQPKIGVQIGYNSARFAQSKGTNASDNGYSTSSLSKYNAGFLLEIPLSKKIFLQPALLYFGNGSQINGQSGLLPANENYSHTTIQLQYLRLPVNLIYKTKLSNRVDLLVGTGLYLAKGISGKGKGKAEVADSANGIYSYSFYSPVNFTYATSYAVETNVNPYDEGFDLLVGIEWQHVQLIANYSRGFPQIYSFDGFGYRNSVFGLNLTYQFAVKK